MKKRAARSFLPTPLRKFRDGPRPPREHSPDARRSNVEIRVFARGRGCGISARMRHASTLMHRTMIAVFRQRLVFAACGRFPWSMPPGRASACLATCRVLYRRPECFRSQAREPESRANKRRSLLFIASWLVLAVSEAETPAPWPWLYAANHRDPHWPVPPALLATRFCWRAPGGG